MELFLVCGFSTPYAMSELSLRLRTRANTAIKLRLSEIPIWHLNNSDDLNVPLAGYLKIRKVLPSPDSSQNDKTFLIYLASIIIL